MINYTNAAICKRGHVYTSDLHQMPKTQKCQTCGAQIITQCQNCNVSVRGTEVYEHVGGWAGSYDPPDFCFNCGTPFPWVSRQGRIYQLQNILDEQDMDEATRLKVREQLESLLDQDVNEDKEIKIWKSIKGKSPELISAGMPIIKTIATQAILKATGL